VLHPLDLSSVEEASETARAMRQRLDVAVPRVLRCEDRRSIADCVAKPGDLAGDDVDYIGLERPHFFAQCRAKLSSERIGAERPSGRLGSYDPSDIMPQASRGTCDEAEVAAIAAVLVAMAVLVQREDPYLVSFCELAH
jgi:hypothetical protein